MSEPLNMKGRTLAWILLGGPILIKHISLILDPPLSPALIP